MTVVKETIGNDIKLKQIEFRAIVWDVNPSEIKFINVTIMVKIRTRNFLEIFLKHIVSTISLTYPNVYKHSKTQPDRD